MSWICLLIDIEKKYTDHDSLNKTPDTVYS